MHVLSCHYAPSRAQSSKYPRREIEKRTTLALESLPIAAIMAYPSFTVARAVNFIRHTQLDMYVSARKRGRNAKSVIAASAAGCTAAGAV